MENILDISSNLVDMDKTISKEEYVSNLIRLLEPILKEKFPNNPVKQEIRVHKDRINFACPICADSMQNSYKKRGNFILEGKHKGFFKCFNCDEFQGINHFFKNFKVELDLGSTNYVSNSVKNFNSSPTYKSSSLLMDIETIEKYAIDREELKEKFQLVEAKDSQIWKWLQRRLQFNPSLFLYSPSKNYVLILNLTPSGKIIGSQKRLFKERIKYMTFGASKLWELLGKGIVPDDIDSVSQIFGIFNINFNYPITSFEGPFDSFLFRNSIAMSGANKKLPLDIKVRYWFDWDKTGTDRSLEYLERGEDVFLWEKLSRDINLPHRKKWDLTDLKVFAKDKNIELPNLENYFSNDPLDMIDI